MKQRFSSLDVQVIAHELSKTIVSLRCSNIYDLSSRIFLLKFAKPNHREQLLIDSGFRCHLTDFARSTAAAPSHFVSRLRKFLRTRRVTRVEQVGTDRVIEIQFSDGAYRLFLEFYAGGNIILTDPDLVIIGLLRTVSEGAEHEQYKQGLKYGLSHRQNYGGIPELTKERVRHGLKRAIDKQAEEAQKPGKKIKKKSGDALRKALAITTTEFPPILLDHALHVSKYDRDAQPEDVISSEERLDQLLAVLQEAQRVVREITSADTAKGYIIAKQKQRSTTSEHHDDETVELDKRSNLVYEDFHPFKPAHLASDSSLTFIERDGYNRTADEFFSSLEGQKLESRLQEREDNAKRKIDNAREEQAKRIDGLQQVKELNVRKAQAIEANVERIEEAVAAVNGLIAQGMDWADIGSLIGNEQARNNPVAQTIRLPLKLYENTVTLLLSGYDDVEEEDLADETESEASDSEDESAQNRTAQKATDKQLAVDIDLAESAWSNARQYYDQKRSAAVKQEKTAQASEKALKSTEQKVMADLKKGLKQEKDVLRPVRKQMWFEKFIYFISSDGYLVLAGKDAQQNEMLYRRYLKRGDVYVHADLHGAATVIVKNNPGAPEAPIPPSTLSQAGHLAVCTSTAWDSKAVMSAWWVNADQVSKTAPTGEYLTTGGFMVRGKKNFLPPAQLLLGFAVLFQISEESKARHVKHRLQNAPVAQKTTEHATDAESDDDFPDASAPQDASAQPEMENDDFPDALNGQQDQDDDFPDVKETADDQNSASKSDQSDEDEPGVIRNNPLQNGGTASQMNVDDDTKNLDDQTIEDEDSTMEDGTEESQRPVESTLDQKVNSDDAGRAASPSPSSTANTKQSNKKQVRGKRGKAKKAATKYAEQDEEDREMAMKLLGSRAAEEKREAEAAENAAKKESAEEARARRRAQHEKAQKEGLEAEEIRRLNLDEGLVDLGEEETEALTQLDALVGTPLPGDEILEAIPICAPWSSLTKYKYKAKMQPGQQKKGKAVREILGKWSKDGSDPKKIDQQSQDIEKIWPREAELIKGWKEAEVVGIIPVKSVRVMMSGGGGGGEKGKGGKGGGKGGRGGKGSKKK